MVFTVFRIVCVLTGIVGLTYMIPICAAIYCQEYQVLSSFIIPMAVSIAVALLALFLGRKNKTSLSTRSGYVVVALSWVTASLFGAIPLYLSGAFPSITDAVFESVSGFTTTGSTVISDVESLPRSINLWRCQTNWLGGMGIVALTVALLPLLGVGGFQLIKNETTGVEKGKLTPKIANTAKILWFLYFGFTIAETVLLKIAGMDFIDALSHSFSTLGTGGFSTRNDSIASYKSPVIDWIVIIFVFLAGVNFNLYYYAICKKFSEIRKNSEFKVYIAIVLLSTVIISLLESSRYGGFFKSIRYSFFQTVSVITTAGFSNDNYAQWTPSSQSIILALFLIGGCSGSTAGGVKIIRWIILGKQLHNEFLKLLHPHGKFMMRIDQKVGRKDLVFNVAAFLFTYTCVVLGTTFFTSLFGMDLFTSLTGAMAMAGNVGEAFNQLAPGCSFGFLPSIVKWWYCMVMIAGRLEFFSIVIFFSPSYWKK